MTMDTNTYNSPFSIAEMEKKDVNGPKIAEFADFVPGCSAFQGSRPEENTGGVLRWVE